MANKQEWLEYFEAINGRKPTADEYHQAIETGEIKEEATEKVEAKEQKVTKEKKTRKNKKLFLGIGIPLVVVILALLGFTVVAPAVRVHNLGFTSLYNREKAEQIIPAPVMMPTFTYYDSNSHKYYTIDSKTFKKVNNEVVTYSYSDGSKIQRNLKSNKLRLLNSSGKIIDDDLSVDHSVGLSEEVGASLYSDVTKQQYYPNFKISAIAYDKVKNRVGDDFGIISPKYYVLPKGKSCNIYDISSGKLVKTVNLGFSDSFGITMLNDNFYLAIGSDEEKNELKILDKNFDPVTLPYPYELGYSIISYNWYDRSNIICITQRAAAKDKVALYNLKTKKIIELSLTTNYEQSVIVGDYFVFHNSTGYATMYDFNGKVVKQGQIELN